MESQALRPQRTSTPIPGMEESFPQFDPIEEFFYQSWKSELHSSDESSSSQQFQPQPFTQPIQPMYYYSQTVIVCPIVQPQYIPCYRLVGYRPDGTYGVLPNCSCGWHL